MPNQSVPGYQGGFVQGGFGQGVPGQSNIDDLQRQLMMGQVYGQNPAVLMDLQLKLQNAMRDQGRNNQMGYLQQLRGGQRLGAVGSRSGAGIDPWLQAMLAAQYGIGGGGGLVG